MFYSFLGIFLDRFYKNKLVKYHSYLKHVKDKEKCIKEFANLNRKNIDAWYHDLENKKSSIIIAEAFYELVKPFLTDERIISYTLDEHNLLDTKTFHEQIKDIKKCHYIYYRRFIDLKTIPSEFSFVKKFNILFTFKKCWNVRKVLNILKWIGLPFIFMGLAFALLLISFTFTTVYIDYEMISSYLHSFLLIVLNFVPILIVMLLLLCATKRLWLSFSLTSLLVFIIGIINKTKLFYRDDVLKLEDIALFKEALVMTSRYKVIITRSAIICAICCIIAAIVLKKLYKKINVKNKYCIISIIFIVITAGVLYRKVYTNSEIYDNVGDTSLINIWLATRQSQIRGLIYPFIYSSTEITNSIPAGYDEQQTKDILSQYSYSDIPSDKKVNVIAVMLEAYNDFSKFRTIDFVEDVYKDLHDIQKNSLSGDIVVSIFGGGTIVTERNFLTGYYHFPTFRSKTNSYVSYFKEQGYVTEAMHPMYGSFYNRYTANINMGFDEYYNYENFYSSIQKVWFVSDSTFFGTITDRLEEVNKMGEAYFNFSVTYQNHGPYSDETSCGTYIKNKGYSDSAYNTFSCYLQGIKNTNSALKDLVSFLDNYDEPTVLIFFGDHNPYLGEDNYTYKELGINFDFNSVDGFLNYYSVPYVIHANGAAKEIFDKSFVGKASTISPVFLMNELFDYLGYEGNSYAKYMGNLKAQTDVISNIYYKIDNKFVLKNDAHLEDLMQQYQCVNYYYAH